MENNVKDLRKAELILRNGLTYLTENSLNKELSKLERVDKSF